MVIKLQGGPSACAIIGTSSAQRGAPTKPKASRHRKLRGAVLLQALVGETKDKAEKSRKMALQRMMSDNMAIVAELNVSKRDLKESKERIERQVVEISTLRMALVTGGLALPATPHGALSVQPSAAASLGENTYCRDDSHNGSMQGGGTFAGHADGQPDSSRITAPSPGSGNNAPRGMSRQQARLADATSTPMGRPGTSARTRRGRANSGNGMTSSPVPGVPEGGAAVINGDMPMGGWWMNEASPFEVSSNITGGATARNASSYSALGPPTSRQGLSTADSSRPWTGANSARASVPNSRPGTSASGNSHGRGGAFVTARTAFTPLAPSGTAGLGSTTGSTGCHGGVLDSGGPGCAVQDGGGASTGATALTSGAVGEGGTGVLHSNPVGRPLGITLPLATPGHAVQSTHAHQGAMMGSPQVLGSTSLLTGQMRPATPSKVTTIGAGFRSFVPSRGNSR